MDASTFDVVLTALFLRLKWFNDFLEGCDLSDPFYESYVSDRALLRDYITDFRSGGGVL